MASGVDAIFASYGSSQNGVTPIHEITFQANSRKYQLLSHFNHGRFAYSVNIYGGGVVIDSKEVPNQMMADAIDAGPPFLKAYSIVSP